MGFLTRTESFELQRETVSLGTFRFLLHHLALQQLSYPLVHRMSPPEWIQRRAQRNSGFPSGLGAKYLQDSIHDAHRSRRSDVGPGDPQVLVYP